MPSYVFLLYVRGECLKKVNVMNWMGWESGDH